MVDDRPPTSDSSHLPPDDPVHQTHQWDDVFESESHHPAIVVPANATAAATLDASSTSHDILPQTDDRYASDVVSDFERLRSTHVTAGYRDGISVGKEASIQNGFDEGFALGGEIGRAVGYIIGCVQGIAAAIPGDKELVRIFGVAKEELKLESMFAREHVSEDGLWTYEVEGEEEGEVTFEQVAWAHPLVKKWQERLQVLAQERGIDLDVLKGRMGDAEDIDELATEIL
jgi:hypothetical protein